MSRFYLIRHAETDAVGSFVAGPGIGLNVNDAGRRQLPLLVATLHDVALTAVVSSPIERTRDTADPIARDHRLEVIVDERLAEFEFGDWIGKTFAELEPDSTWRRFNDVRSITRAPSGELMLDVQHRAVAALLDIRDRFPSGRIAVVSHGDVIRAHLMYLLGMPIDFVHRIETTPAGISIVDVDADGLRVLQVNGSIVPEGI